MKDLSKNTIVCFFLLILTGFYSCEDATDKEWGTPKVYMPQASMLNGGINNNYPVPLNNNPATNNYVIDEATQTLNVVLGVYRSGLQPLEAYQVKLSVDNGRTSEIVSSTNRGVELPSDVYSFPTEVSVKDGERQAVFHLSVNLGKLISDYPSYSNKKLCLALSLSNPSKYELNEKLSTTNVIIDGASFLPAPVIVKGGDFAPGSETYWTAVSLNGTKPALADAAKIGNGYLTMNYGTEKTDRSVAVYQPIELVEGNKYRFSAKASGTGADAAEMAFILSTIQPQENQSYNKENNYFSLLDVWWGQHPNFSDQFSGTFPQMGQWEKGIDRKTGEFTANFSKGYMIILITTWNGTIGNVTFDDIKIEEL